MSKQVIMQKLVDRFVLSGQSRRSFCLQEGINYHTFKYWQRKLNSLSAPKPSFIRIERPAQSYCLTGVELEFPNGVKLRNIGSLDLIRQLITLEKCSV